MAPKSASGNRRSDRQNQNETLYADTLGNDEDNARVEPTLVEAPAGPAVPHSGLLASAEMEDGENLSSTPVPSPEESDDQANDEKLDRLRASVTSPRPDVEQGIPPPACLPSTLFPFLQR